MSGIGRWKKILGQTGKQKVAVRVGQRVEQLTSTQSYRFDQLSNKWKTETAATNGPFEESRYTLADAAFRLQRSESQILELAVRGSRVVYVNASGLHGAWRHVDAEGRVTKSDPQALASGYLALPPRSCADLLANGGTSVKVLEYRLPEAPAAADFDPRQVVALESRGEGETFFCLSEPLPVEKDHLVLMAPLGEA